MIDSPEPLRQALAGRYDIERPIGQGGMATVDVARDVQHGREVAVKVLPPGRGIPLGPNLVQVSPPTTAGRNRSAGGPVGGSGDRERHGPAAQIGKAELTPRS